ncbi:MAG: OmpA family protein [Pasteurella sp.]|nr:OmpA family protein [Pasteurella sp.]
MNAKLPLGIVIASSLFIAACSTSPYHQPGSAWHQADEPALVIKPLSYNGRTWFDTNSATLRPVAKKELKAVASKLAEAKAKSVISENNKLVVIGHTDSRASKKYNQKLSEKRAHTVASFLVAQGIPSKAIITQGRGENQPVASNHTKAGMQKNRRVEIHIQGTAIRLVYN